MSELVVDLRSRADVALDAVTVGRDDDGRIGSAQRAWLREIWMPYAARAGNSAKRTVAFQTRLPLEVVLVERHELTLDEKLFGEVIQVHATFGWDGVAALADTPTPITAFTREMLFATIARVDDLVGNTLLELQREATALARVEIEERGAFIDKALTSFRRNTGYGGMDLDLAVERKDELFRLFRECVRVKRRFDAAEAQIKERDRKDGGDVAHRAAVRKREHYRALLVKEPQAKRKATLDALDRLHEQVAAIFAPALLVLDELDDDVFDRLDEKDRGRASTVHATHSKKVELAYTTRIHRILVELRAALSAIEVSLGNPGIEPTLADHRKRSHRDRTRAGVQTAVIEMAITREPGVREFVTGGVLQGIYGIHLADRERSAYGLRNRVLGRPQVLRRLLAHVEETAPTSLRHAVLRQYVIALEGRLDQLRDDAAFVDSIWRALELAVALAGLLLAVLSIPFGAGAVAVPAALAATLSAAGLFVAVIGIALLAHSIASLVIADGAAAGELRDTLLDIGRDDTRALLEIGELVSRHTAVHEALTTGLALELAKLVAQHKLRALELALDLDGYLDDIEMLRDA